MNAGLAPVVLFVYNRPHHARRTVESLLGNRLASGTDLVVYSDGPKGGRDEEAVIAVREVVRTVHGFKSVKLIERADNLGLSRSVISGVTETVGKSGRVIVVEDDLVVSPFFLQYMNEALEMYEAEERVVSIHGYVPPVTKPFPETFFIRGADCWGWATWKRGWDLFDPDGQRLHRFLKENRLTREFDFGGAFSYTKMLRDQVKGRNDSWAIRWYASAFLKNRLTLYPGVSLVQNIGLDSSGTHCGSSKRFETAAADRAIRLQAIEIKESLCARECFTEYFRSSGSLFRRFLAWIRTRSG